GLPCRSRVDDGRERARRLVGRVAGPVRAKLSRKPPLLLASREYVDRRIWMAVSGHRQHQMRGRSEAGQSERVAVANVGEAKRPPTDRARTEQRGGVRVIQRFGNWDGERRRRRYVLGVSAVAVAAVGLKSRTQILLARRAPATFTARPTDPGDADSISFFALAHPTADRCV